MERILDNKRCDYKKVILTPENVKEQIKKTYKSMRNFEFKEEDFEDWSLSQGVEHELLLVQASYSDFEDSSSTKVFTFRNHFGWDGYEGKIEEYQMSEDLLKKIISTNSITVDCVCTKDPQSHMA